MRQWENFISRWWGVYLVLLVMGIVVFANSWGNELFWDDLDNFVNNSYVHSWEYFGRYFSENLIAGSGISSNYWRPMMLLVWSLCWGFWQDWPVGYRVVNLMLHAGCGVLVFYIWQKLFDKKWLSWIVCLVFAIHPLQTEAISYASGLSDPLAGVFILGAVLSYLRHRLDNWKWGYWLCLGLMAGGLMSRETVVVLPGIIGFIELWLWRIGRVEKKWQDWLGLVWSRVGGLIGISAVYLYLRGTVLNFGGTFNIYEQKTEFTEHPVYRLLTFAKVLGLFVGLLFVPIGLHMDRLITIERGLVNPQVVLGLFLIGLALIIMTIGWKWMEKCRVVWFGVGWFGLWLFPVSNLVIPVNGLMYEHWMYLPMLGFWTAVLYPAGTFLIRAGFGRFAVVIGSVWLVGLGVGTIVRNHDWAEATSFYRQVLEYNPTSLRVWNNLAMTYANRGDLDQAEPIYQKARELDPDNWVPIHNLANIYRDRGEVDKSLEYYILALSKNPNSQISLVLFWQECQKEAMTGICQKMLAPIAEQNPMGADITAVMTQLAIKNADWVNAMKYWQRLALIEKEYPGLLDLRQQIDEHKENFDTYPSF